MNQKDRVKLTEKLGERVFHEMSRRMDVWRMYHPMLVFQYDFVIKHFMKKYNLSKVELKLFLACVMYKEFYPDDMFVELRKVWRIMFRAPTKKHHAAMHKLADRGMVNRVKSVVRYHAYEVDESFLYRFRRDFNAVLYQYTKYLFEGLGNENTAIPASK